jgi:pyruvate formate lyase activating enzyme
LALLCLERCWAEALELKGRTASVQEVIGEVIEDRIFYEKTGGGVTISGGEPLAQPDFTRALLAQAKKEGLHTAVDTSGLGDWSIIDSITGDTDLFLYDIKCHDPDLHKQLTGVNNRVIKANLAYLLRSGADVILRMPLVANLNDQEDEMASLAKWLRDLQPGLILHLLPYHKYGEQKYESLGLKYSLLQPAPPQPEKLLKLADIAETHGLKTTIKGMEKSQAL